MKFNFVCLSDAVSTKKFLDKVPRGIECINYMTIINKLAKNDYAHEDPTDVVVSSYLVKSLYTIMKKDVVEELYYVISSPDDDIIGNVSNQVESFTERKITYNIYSSPKFADDINPDTFTEVFVINEEA